MKKIKNYLQNNKILTASLSSLVVGFLFAIIFLSIFNLDPLEMLEILFTNGLGDDVAVSKFFVQWALFIFLGLSVMIGFRIGLFNIGVAGQITFSVSLALMYVKACPDQNPAILLGVSIIIVIVGAGFFASLAGFLKAFFNVHEVVSTIMLNWIVAYLFEFLYENGTLFIQNQNSLMPLPEGLNTFFDIGDSSFSWLFFLAIFLAFVLFFVISFTRLGLKIRVTGTNFQAAKYANYNDKFLIISTFIFSGAIAGMAGLTYFYALNLNEGITLDKSVLTSPIDIGFMGITISLVGLNNPIGIIFSSLLFTFFDNPVGTNAVVQAYHSQRDIVELFYSVIVYFMAISNMFVYFVNWNNLKNSWKNYLHRLRVEKKLVPKIFLSFSYFLTFDLLRKSQNWINTKKRLKKRK